MSIFEATEAEFKNALMDGYLAAETADDVIKKKPAAMLAITDKVSDAGTAAGTKGKKGKAGKDALAGSSRGSVAGDSTSGIKKRPASAPTALSEQNVETHNADIEAQNTQVNQCINSNISCSQRPLPSWQPSISLNAPRAHPAS